MNKKIKFDAIDLINKLFVLSKADSNKEMVIDITPIKEFIKNNDKDIAELNSYYGDILSTYQEGEKITALAEEVEIITNNLVLQMQNIIKEHYSQIKIQQKQYNGITAYFVSDGIAKFFNKDEHDYFGHCIAFNEKLTELICLLIKGGVKIVELAIILLAYLTPIVNLKLKDIIYWLENIVGKIYNNIDEYQNHPYGMAWVYFDNVQRISNLADKIELIKQLDHVWNPSEIYGGKDWIQVWPKSEDLQISKSEEQMHQI
jgi:hypothetical protein